MYRKQIETPAAPHSDRSPSAVLGPAPAPTGEKEKPTTRIDRLGPVRPLVWSVLALAVLTLSAASPALEKSRCTDDSQCQAGRVCEAGECTRGCRIAGTFHSPHTLNPANPCESCRPAKSTSDWSNRVDGRRCDDGDPCTEEDSCRAGVCTGRRSMTCKVPDQCHEALTCDLFTKVCSSKPKPDGTPCDDGNTCTQDDTCQAGVCTGGPAKTCAASDQCHDPGTCDPATGVCSNPPKADGATCNDGNACTQTDTCQAGVCTGGNAKTCAASDQCHDPGTCDPATGVCSNPPKADGATCNDGNACTQTDTCQAGVCTGGNAKTCAASDQCHDPGTCDPATGACSNPPKPDGVTCDDGNACTQNDACMAGVCTGMNEKTCTASDQCHDPGTCDPATGVCSNPVKADGSACDDGNLCTTGDTCQGGTCTAGPAVVCGAGGCYESTCDPATGKCMNTTMKPDLSPCDDGNFCTVNDECFCGTCIGTNGRYCPDDGDVSTMDFCDSAAQACVHVLPSGGVPPQVQCAPGTCPIGDRCCVTQSGPGFCVPSGQTCTPPNGTPCGDAVCTAGEQCCGGTACCRAGTTCQNGACVPTDPTAQCILPYNGDGTVYDTSIGSAECCQGQFCCGQGQECNPATLECFIPCGATTCDPSLGQTCCPTDPKGCCDSNEVCFSPNPAVTAPACALKPTCSAGTTYVPSENQCCADVDVCNDAQGEPAACCNAATETCNTATGTCEPL